MYRIGEPVAEGDFSRSSVASSDVRSAGSLRLSRMNANLAQLVQKCGRARRTSQPPHRRSPRNQDLARRDEEQAGPLEAMVGSTQQLTVTVEQNTGRPHDAEGGQTIEEIADSWRQFAEITAAINVIAIQTKRS